MESGINRLQFEFTVAGDEAARTITLPLVESRVEGALSYNCIVDWGDDTTPSLVTAYDDIDRIHTYTEDGTYIVKISGMMEGWSFNDGGDKLKITDIISWGGGNDFEGFKYLANGFKGCENLSSIGTGPIPAIGTGILSEGFSQTFRFCQNILEIPSGLFDKHPNTESFANCFYGCADVTTVPVDLFRKNTLVTSFSGTFQRMGSLTTIPADLFRYNTLVETFAQLFYYDGGLLAVPADLFKYNTLVTDMQQVFRRCISLTTIPADLFRYNTLVTNFQYAFDLATSLESLPADLFKYNTAVTTFNHCFHDTNKLQQRSDIFFAEGEEDTRFLNQSPNFTSCFERDSFTGTQGTAPALWDCDFGTGTPTKTDCWEGAGNSTASLDNYGDIPVEWI